MEYGGGELTVTEHSNGEGGAGAWLQRLLHLTNTVNGVTTTRALIHLQFLAWPPGWVVVGWVEHVMLGRVGGEKDGYDGGGGGSGRQARLAEVIVFYYF